MIKKFYTKRIKPHWKWDAARKQFWSFGFDIYLQTGKRMRESGFSTAADAIAAVGRIRQAEKDKRYGFTPDAAKPRLEALVERKLATIEGRRERVRSGRVLRAFLALLAPHLKVEDVTTADVRLYVERRLRDGLKPQSVNRELNIIAATLNGAQTFYPTLAQWVPPRLPRLKESKARRERVITDDEMRRLLSHLLAPQREGERLQSAPARRRVGLQVQFALLTGVRHGEMSAIQKEHIDWEARSLKVVGTKTDKVTNSTRYIAPLTETMLTILREFCAESAGAYVFTSAGNITPKFYEVLKAGCAACGIPYGRETSGGFVLHDARHTATTRMLQGGVDLSTIQSFTGHSDKNMVLYYSHASPESRARAAAVLEAYAGGERCRDEPEA